MAVVTADEIGHTCEVDVEVEYHRGWLRAVVDHFEGFTLGPRRGCRRIWDLTIRVPSAFSTHDIERSIVARQDGSQPPGRRRHRARADARVRGTAARPRHLLPGPGPCPRSSSAGRREDRRLAQP